jgi:protein TonB
LAESDAPLIDADPIGPIDGILEVEKPKPPPPPPPKPKRIAKLRPPVPSSSNRAPKYTSGAKRARIEGVVVVQFIINKDGTVGKITIVSGPVELGKIVLKTVAKWRFKPATRGGVPVAFKKTMQIQFRLEKV